MEYLYNGFAHPAAAARYFHHHYNAVLIPLRRGVPAEMVDSVWVVINPAAYGVHVDENWILDDVSTMRQTQTRNRFEPISGNTTHGRWIVQDDTWVLDSHDDQEASDSNTKQRVSNFLETRTSEIKRSDGEEEEICVVCQEDLLGTNRIATLDCRHRYHVHCIKTWLTLKNFCPICKAAALSIP